MPNLSYHFSYVFYIAYSVPKIYILLILIYAWEFSMIRFILSILFILSFVFSSYAYDINDYKKVQLPVQKKCRKNLNTAKLV